jgi:hypothetical protein
VPAGVEARGCLSPSRGGVELLVPRSRMGGADARWGDGWNPSGRAVVIISSVFVLVGGFDLVIARRRG